MQKIIFLNLIFLLIIISIIYFLWAVQPMPPDDWGITKTHVLFIRPPLPETGQQIRYAFSGAYLLPINPFSLFRPWSLLTAVIVISIFWIVLRNEHLAVRAGLTLLAALGFPYLGHIGPWNQAASHYTVSVIWMMVWYAVYRNISYTNERFLLKGITLFILTFIAASWHEVWFISFVVITAYFLFDMFYSLRKGNQFFNLRSHRTFLIIILAYVLAILFYTRGGPSQFIDKRMYTPGRFVSLFNWSHALESFLMASKEIISLIKDSLPIFLLIIYLKLNNRFKTILSADFRLFFAIALGSLLFIYADAFVHGPTDWRARWLCVLALSAALYAFPISVLTDNLIFTTNNHFITAVRIFSIIVAVIWLVYNAFFTYLYTNIDVVKYLQYRHMVLEHNPNVMKELGPCTLPKNRPKGVAQWSHAWGAQDDRYRIFLGCPDFVIHRAVKDVWKRQSKNRENLKENL